MVLNKKQQEFLRFCIVGSVCTLLDSMIYYLLRTMVPYRVALVCGYVTSLAVNCMLTVRWTFQALPNKTNIAGILTSHLFNLFVVRMGMMWVLTRQFMLNDSVAYIPTMIVSIGTNFLIIRTIINIFSK